MLDLWQFTPLHEAASKARADVCTLLLSHDADPTIPNCHDKTALDLVPSDELRKKIECMFFIARVYNTCMSFFHFQLLHSIYPFL